MKHTLALLAGLLLLAAATLSTHAANVTFGTGGNQFAIDFVDIGNAGNADDTTGDPNPAGSVAYDYRIGKYEISEDMINKANAPVMDGGGNLGITKDTRGVDKPATSVSWFEAATFVNWLNTSSGGSAAYKFDMVGGTFALWDSGADPLDYNASNPYRSLRATYWLPSMDEWYKAAYYDPNTGTYFNYATGSNTTPTAVASGTTPGTAVYFQATATGPADITNAGGLSPYGTMAQSGNVDEWEETAVDLVNSTTGEHRGRRGGSWVGDSFFLRSTGRNFSTPPNGFDDVGFRVAGVIPEPSRTLLGVVGLVGVLLRRRRCSAFL